MSLTALGFWLFAREATVDWRRRYRNRRVQAMLNSWEGQPVRKAEARLAPPNEIVNGSAGRSLYIWAVDAACDILVSRRGDRHGESMACRQADHFESDLGSGA